MGFKLLIKVVISIFIINIVCNINVMGVNADTEMNFKNITIKDGLTQGSVEALFQDSEGYIWIGTNDGLNRYNGYEFKVYGQEHNNNNSLVNNYILDINEDVEGNIWVATANGLSKIHKDRSNITNYLSGKDNGNLSDANTTSVLITKDNKIYVATINGLNLYDESTDSFNRIFDGDKLSGQCINSLAEDKNGDIWVGTESGLTQIDYETKETKHYFASADEDSIADNNIYKVYYDYCGYIWIGTYNNGASRINLDTGDITNYDNLSNSLAKNDVKNFLRDRFGTMWIATAGGLSKLNEEEGNFKNYKNKIYDANTLVNDYTFSLIEDKNGLIWVGTYAGISIFNPQNKIIHYNNDFMDNNTISENMVMSVYEDEDNYLWVGTKTKGLNIIDRNSEKVIRVDEDGGNRSSNSIYDIDGYKEYIALATRQGIKIINKTTKTLINYTKEDGVPNNVVKNVCFDSRGLLWIGTTSGLCILDVINEQIIDITNIIDKYSPDDNYIGKVYEDSKGNYWVGTFVKGGLIKINPNTKEVKSYKYDEHNDNTISNNAIRSIVEDNKGDLWIGTSLGLNKFVQSDEKFERYTTTDGLPNNTIYGILIDSDNNPWMSTNNGISKFDVKNRTFINLDYTDGLQSNEFNGKGYFENKKGEFIFAGINGINIFNPKEIKITNSVNKIVFDEFKVNGVMTDNIDGESFERYQKNITIKVFLPSYTNNKGIQYYYKIDGDGKEWNEMERNYLYLSNLNPGEYTLRVKARSSNGIMSEENSVNFKIKPHFLLSKYAILLYLMMILLWIYSNKRRVQRLDRLIAKRTEELSFEMEKNKELFDKVIKLEKTKNNYFINMSHELRTPLNVIYAIEQLIANLNSSERGIEKKKLNEYMDILGNNVQRLLKIINDLIDTSKMENGNYKLDLNEEDIVYIVEEAALSLKQYIESKKIELVIDPEIEEKIMLIDKYAIERCIVNIVGNAAKFTNENGKIKVVIKDLGQYVKIEILDNGKGIKKEHHDVIFDRFSQVVDQNQEIKGGSGLGLTITKQIIDLHKGEIYVESEEGVGTKFTIILPVNS